MAELEELRGRILLVEELQGVVRTMKALARVGVRRYQGVEQALQAEAADVELALQAFLLERRFREDGESGSPPAGPARREGGVGVILFGSDHGLCGGFNERVLAFAREQRGPFPSGKEGKEADRLALVGRRLVPLIEAERGGTARAFPLPQAVEGLPELVHDLLLLIEGWWFGPDPVARLVLIHHAAVEGGAGSPRLRQLLPLDGAWLAALARRRWPSPGRPLLLGPATPLFRTILRAHLGLGLLRAAVASLACEHASRLAAMHGASRSIEERLEELRHAYRQRRQAAITDELLDIVAGFEALSRDG